ncbi:MAG: hypothetical protein LBB07_02005, partial [Bifidobacteriaceae bacterium]|nr:hypothetical protein [Bifidobacteriaceae bacterium]
ALLSEAGFSWYEISSFSRTHTPSSNRLISSQSTTQTPASATPSIDYRCKHNLGYWRGGSWLGIGAGAASSVANLREANPRRLADYIAGKPPDSAILAQSELELERKMLFTRTSGGLPLDEINPKTVDILLKENLIERCKLDEGLLVLSLKGRLLQDEIVRML